MRKAPLFVFIILLLALLLASLNGPVSASPTLQFTPFPTPTPGPDGRIIYIAQDNDSAWRIAAIFNIPLDELRELNKWGENPLISPGDEIFLGHSGPSGPSPTPGPTATSGPQTPTPSPEPGWGNLCVLLYNDINGDSQHQEEEPGIAGGAIDVSDRRGSVSHTKDSQGGYDAVCFEQLPEGTYNVTVAIPEGYNPTTVTNRSLKLQAGDVTFLPFGAQANSETIAEAPVIEGGAGKSPLLGILGSLLLLASLGLVLFAGRMMKRVK